MAYKMSPKKVFDVLRQLQRDAVISMATAKMIAATYAERQLDPCNENGSGTLQGDSAVICATCGQTVLPF